MRKNSSDRIKSIAKLHVPVAVETDIVHKFLRFRVKKVQTINSNKYRTFFYITVNIAADSFINAVESQVLLVYDD